MSGRMPPNVGETGGAQWAEPNDLIQLSTAATAPLSICVCLLFETETVPLPLNTPVGRTKHSRASRFPSKVPCSKSTIDTYCGSGSSLLSGPSIAIKGGVSNWRRRKRQNIPRWEFCLSVELVHTLLRFMSSKQEKKRMKFSTVTLSCRPIFLQPLQEFAPPSLGSLDGCKKLFT